ncbi:MAG: hypothetical protein R3233_03345 [Xanthomonadales bacterium]|nr:hypothetical protein [Xanthomonadales bacterium]
MKRWPRILIFLLSGQLLLSACVGAQSRSYSEARPELEAPHPEHARVVYFKLNPADYEFSELADSTRPVEPGLVDGSPEDSEALESRLREIEDRFADAPRVVARGAPYRYFAWVDYAPGRYRMVFANDEEGVCGLPMDLVAGETRYVHYFPRKAYIEAVQKGDLVVVGTAAAAVTAAATLTAAPTIGGGVAVTGSAAPILIVPLLAVFAVSKLFGPEGPCDHYEYVITEVPESFALAHLPALRQPLGWSWEWAKKED